MGFTTAPRVRQCSSQDGLAIQPPRARGAKSQSLTAELWAGTTKSASWDSSGKYQISLLGSRWINVLYCSTSPSHTLHWKPHAATAVMSVSDMCRTRTSFAVIIGTATYDAAELHRRTDSRSSFNFSCLATASSYYFCGTVPSMSCLSRFCFCCKVCFRAFKTCSCLGPCRDTADSNATDSRVPVSSWHLAGSPSI